MKGLAFLFDVFGRVRRRDFWLFLAASALIYSLMFRNALTLSDWHRYEAMGLIEQIYRSLGNQYAFILFFVMQLATLAVIIRRWHDRDKSGFWTFIGFVPVIGQVWMIVELGFLPGSDDNNRYGPSPKAETRVF